MKPLLGNALDALRPMLCERTGERKMGKEEESIGVVKETQRRCWGLAFHAEEFESGRGDHIWTMGMRCICYLRCCLVSFSILFIIICMGLPTVQHTFVTGGQFAGVDAPL